MPSFSWISVILSMVLGLGVTRLLTGLVSVFRSRARAEIDWLPLVWAGSIFLFQLQFWWGANALPALVRQWTFEEFLALVSLVIALFLSAALILPFNEMEKGASLRRFFEEEGRWSLAALSLYLAMTIPGNIFFFGTSPLDPQMALILVLIALPGVVFFTRSRRVQMVCTLAFVPLSILGAILASDQY